MSRRYRAVALVREGIQRVGDSWEGRFLPVTLSTHDSWEKAEDAVRAFIVRSGPRGLEWTQAFVIA